MGNEPLQEKNVDRKGKRKRRTNNSFKLPKLKRGQYPRRPTDESITEKVERLKLLSKNF